MGICLAGTPLSASEVEAMNKGIHEVEIQHNLLSTHISIDKAAKISFLIGELEYIGIEFTVVGREWSVYSLAVPHNMYYVGDNALNKAALMDIQPEVRKFLWEYCRFQLA